MISVRDAAGGERRQPEL